MFVIASFAFSAEHADPHVSDLIAGGSDRVRLSELTPLKRVVLDLDPQPDVTFASIKSPHVLWAHPEKQPSGRSEYVFLVPANGVSLRGFAMLGPCRWKPQSACHFEITDDRGKVLWTTGDSPIMRHGVGRFFDVEVRSNSRVHLVVRAEGGIRFLHAAWFEPQFVLQGKLQHQPQLEVFKDKRLDDSPPPLEVRGDRVYLSDLKPIYAYAHGLDRPETIPPIKHKGEVAKHALWAHPETWDHPEKAQWGKSEYLFLVPSNAELLRGIAVINQMRGRPMSKLHFKIFDEAGTELWSTGSAPLQGAGAGQPFNIPVTAGEKIRLLVEGAHRDLRSCHAAWFEPQFVLQGKLQHQPQLEVVKDKRLDDSPPPPDPHASVDLGSLGISVRKDSGGTELTISRDGYVAVAYGVNGSYLLDNFRGHRAPDERILQTAIEKSFAKRSANREITLPLQQKRWLGTRYTLGDKIDLVIDLERAAFDLANSRLFREQKVFPATVHAVEDRVAKYQPVDADLLGIKWGRAPSDGARPVKVPELSHHLMKLLRLRAYRADALPKLLQHPNKPLSLEILSGTDIFVEGKLVACKVYAKDPAGDPAQKFKLMEDILYGLGLRGSTNSNQVLRVLSGYDNSSTSCMPDLSFTFSFYDRRFIRDVEDGENVRYGIPFGGAPATQGSNSGRAAGMF